MPRRYPSLRTFRAIYIIPERGTLSNGSECCICFDRYDDNAHGPVGITSNRECEHVFGRRCLEAYLDSANPSRNTCPVCRRKWYSRRSTNPSTPRDTNTSQVLSPPTQLGSFVRDGFESRARHRLPPLADAEMERAVELLANNIEALEGLERRDTVRLEQDLRVRLQQVEGRIHAFLERNITASDVSPGPVLRRRTRILAHNTTETATTHRQDSAVAESNSDQHPYPIYNATFQSSTVSLPDLRLPERQINASPTVTPPATDHRRDFAAVVRRPSSIDHANAFPIPATDSRTEVSYHLGYQRNAMLSQPSSQTRQEVNARGLRNHLRTLRHDRSWNTNTQASGPHNASVISLPDIAEAEGNPPPRTCTRMAAFGATVGDHTDQDTPSPAQIHGYAAEHAPILYPRFRTSRLLRARSTHGFAYGTQPVGTPSQPVLAASMPEREVGRRGRATATRSPRGLSRIMSISSLRDLVSDQKVSNINIRHFPFPSTSIAPGFALKPGVSPTSTIHVAAYHEEKTHSMASGFAPQLSSASEMFLRDHTKVDTPSDHAEECSICHEEFRDSFEQRVRITGIPACSHAFGEQCLEQWLATDLHTAKGCPMCRTEWVAGSPRPQYHHLRESAEDFHAARERLMMAVAQSRQEMERVRNEVDAESRDGYQHTGRRLPDHMNPSTWYTFPSEYNDTSTSSPQESNITHDSWWLPPTVYEEMYLQRIGSIFSHGIAQPSETNTLRNSTRQGRHPPSSPIDELGIVDSLYRTSPDRQFHVPPSRGGWDIAQYPRDMQRRAMQAQATTLNSSFVTPDSDAWTRLAHLPSPATTAEDFITRTSYDPSDLQREGEDPYPLRQRLEYLRGTEALTYAASDASLIALGEDEMPDMARPRRLARDRTSPTSAAVTATRTDDSTIYPTLQGDATPSLSAAWYAAAPTPHFNPDTQARRL
ncbi:uncharacterized protein M421DRAFT_408773 [Didymella exigua CBS 183.55]|uniref:RING-type domain-containing protein n=1 Tax=Didymella exigua CBS 183.55 TaxID=1150837 RepID=A0A6A5RUL5_9PLEO|nr:uncharacterized protein M421DRAFT_408773 [Didymella exigua CBS 183.55]KAF1931259.1 hypothetical protein M421DRAFT_408773 [Didymella exigua CBS 183.55]